jgi:hypothetical protein
MNTHKEQYDAGRLATTSGKTPEHFGSPAPTLETKENGQHSSYWILSESERAKGFVRPVRTAYKHVGRPAPKYPMRGATPEEIEQFKDEGWIEFEVYPEGSNGLGKWWSQADLDSVGNGCGTVTTMSRAIAETYAREPGFYGATMCVGCQKHLPVGEDGEFVWMNAHGGASQERVGT